MNWILARRGATILKKAAGEIEFERTKAGLYVLCDTGFSGLLTAGEELRLRDLGWAYDDEWDAWYFAGIQPRDGDAQEHGDAAI